MTISSYSLKSNEGNINVITLCVSVQFTCIMTSCKTDA